MFIQTEETPNPETLKFMPGQDVMADGTQDFSSADAAKISPLAEGLFKVDGVERVYFGDSFITVTKTSDKQWEILKPSVMDAIMDHFSSGKPLFTEEVKSDNAISEDDDEIVKQIKELLETRVQPAVAMDGGNIVFRDFQEGVVYVEMQGACSGCPSSTATLKSGIENMLRHFIPEVEEVRPVQAD